MSDMIGSFTSGATASLVAKNGTNQLSQSFEDRFWCSRCLNDRIEVPNMIKSFANGATASLVAKNGTKQLSQPFEDRLCCSRCLNNSIEVPNMIGSFESGATFSLVAKNGCVVCTPLCAYHCRQVSPGGM